MKTLITRIKRLALALCFVTPLVSWADAITAVNPVTGETETYTYKYVGIGEWNAADWQNAADPVANPDKAPQTPSSNVWDPILIDGPYTLTAPTLEGWAIRLGLYNGAKVTVPTLNKIQAGTTMWFTVDATSKLTLSLPGTGHLGDNQNVNFYVAAPQGLVFNSNFATSQNDTDTFNYYLAGDGSVSFQGISAGTHKIKMADVTLSGSATPSVASKTLVSFTSTTKTFTADAAIKVYGTDGETLVDTVNTATVNTTGTTTLTEESAVGSCELVQTSTGIELYYVDGDPSAIVAKTYKPSISVNLCDGSNPLTTAADVGFGDFAVPGTSWNNILSSGGNSSVFTTPLSTIYGTDSTGAQTLIPGASAAVSGTRGSWGCSSLVSASDVRNGYADDNSTYPTPTVTISGIPYYQYKVVVYTATDAANVSFGYVTVNGTDYTYVEEDGVKTLSAGTSAWGASGASNTAEALAEGVNVLVSPVTSGSTATVVGHNSSGRGCIAAVQIVEVPKTAEDGELVINVSGDTTYTVSADETYTTVYVTGVGTLAFDGEGTITTTTLNVGNGVIMSLGSGITTTTVTGSGTIVYDGAQPSTTLGFNDSANWLGTVWVKNIGTSPAGETANTAVTLGTDTNTAADNTINLWGNVNSCVKFTNVRGHVAASACPWTLILEDDGDKYAWYNNNGWTAQNKDPVFAKLAGDGTFYDTYNDGCRQNVTFTDASEFTGTFNVGAKRIGIGGTNTADNNQNYRGTIEIVSGAVATIASGKTWTSATGFRVNGTLNVDGTLSCSASAAVSGSGTVVFTGRYPTPVDGDNETKWWKNANWTGTVQIANKSGMVADCAFNSYGTAASTVELNNVTGYLQANFTCAPKLKVTGTLSLTNGSSGKASAFKVGTLLGSGTISGSSSAPTAVLNVTDDWSGFTGGIGLNSSKCVVFGATIPDTLAAGTIYVSEGATVEIKTSGNWWATGGIVVNGTLKASGRGKWGGGTPMVINETGVLELTSTGNVDESNSTDYNYGNVTGTGTIKFNGSGYRGFPYTSPADTLSIVAEQANGLVFRQDGKVIGSLSGTKNLRSDLGNTDKTLTIKQAKDGVWSGIFKGGQDRLATIVVAPGDSTTGTLTLAGTQDQDGWADALTVSGSVNLTGTWKGDTTVSGTFGGTGTLTGNLTFAEGSTFKAFAADDADGLVVSGTVTYPAEGKVTVDVSAIEPETDVALLKAAGLNRDNFALADGTPEGYSLDVVDGVLTLKVPVTKVTITVPAVENAMVAVTVGGVAVQPITEGGTTYSVLDGAAVVVTYTAAEGYAIEGTASFSFNASEGYTVDTTGTTAAQYVVSMTVNNVTTKYTTLQAALNAITLRQQRVVLLANETAGATVPAGTYSFYIIPGEFTYGTIAFPEGDYITSVTETSVKKDEGSSDLIPAVAYTCAPADIIVTVGAVRSLYSLADPSTAIAAATAGGAGSTVKFVNGGASYREFMESSGFEYDSENDIYTLAAVPVAAVYNGQVLINNFTSLAAAVEAAEAGQTVKLLADVTLNSTLTLPAGKTLTMDLGGFTIYSGNDSSKRIVVNGTVTMTNGVVDGQTTVYDPNNSTAMIRVNGSLTLGANLTIRNTINAVAAFGTGSLTVNGATINALGFAISTNGSATGDNASNGTVLAINSGTITSTDVAVYLPSGTMTINGGTITGSTGVYAKGGSLSVPSTSTAVITGNGANADWSYNGNGANSTGDALVIDNSAYPYGPATATIAGGTYESTNGDAIGNYTKDAETLPTATGFVTGGTFSSDVSAFCAPGYTAVEEDGVWTVEALPVIAAATWDGSRTATSMFGGYNPIYVDPRVTPLCGKAYVGIASYKRTGASATTPWSAAAAEGVTVTYTLAEGDDAIATINGDEITFTATGSVTLTATLTESSGAQFAKIATITCKTAVAEVNDTVYGTLSDALKAAGNISPSAKVSLIGEGAVISGTVSKGDVTLDLAGYTITDTGSTANTMKITVSGGKLTVVNTEAEGGIETANAITAGKPVFTVTNGELVLGTGLTVDATDDRIIAYINPTKAANVATVTVDGATLRKTETATYAVIQGHGNDAGTATVNVRSGLVSTTGLAGMYCPAQHTTVNVTGGTVVGKTGIYVKNGTLNITGGAVEGTGAAVAYKYTSSGFSTTGDALVIDSCGFPGGSATVSVTGGTFTSANGAAVASYAKCDDPDYATVTDYVPVTGFITGGTFDSDPSAYVADGYAATESAGVWTVAAKSGIDPTDPTSTQEVTPTAEEIEAAGSAEAAAIAAATVTVPTGVSGVDAPTYKTYFTYSATPTETAGTYTVAITGLADEVTETADGNALAALEAATAGGTLSAEVAVKPGLYYGTVAGADVTTLKAPAGTLNTTGKLDLSGVTKPSTGEAFFIKIKVGTTAFAAEE